jgi:hypothetical protein
MEEEEAERGGTTTTGDTTDSNYLFNSFLENYYNKMTKLTYSVELCAAYSSIGQVEIVSRSSNYSTRWLAME